MLGKIRDKYQVYCTMYKTHVMATHHRGKGYLLDRDINLHIENSETTGLEMTMRAPMAKMLQLTWENQRQKCKGADGMCYPVKGVDMLI